MEKGVPKGKRPETMRFKHRDYNTCHAKVEGPEHKKRLRELTTRIRAELKRLNLDGKQR